MAQKSRGKGKPWSDYFAFPFWKRCSRTTNKRIFKSFYSFLRSNHRWKILMIVTLLSFYIVVRTVRRHRHGPSSVVSPATHEALNPFESGGLGDLHWGCLLGKEKHHNMTLAQSSTIPRFSMWIMQTFLDPMISAQLQLTGAFDLHVLAAISRTVQAECALSMPVEANPLVIDVGANVGFFSLYMASQGCQVLAFEPQESLMDPIKTSTCLNGLNRRMNIKNAALAATNDGEETELYYDGWNVGDARLAHSCEKAGGYTRCQQVDSIVQLDDVIPEREQILLMKIDVSGMESSVLRSMERLLASQSVYHIVLNYNPAFIGAQESVSILEKLHNYGYSIFYLPFKQKGVSRRKIPTPHFKDTLHLWAIDSLTRPDAPQTVQVMRIPEEAFSCFPSLLKAGKVEGGRKFGDLFVLPHHRVPNMFGGRAEILSTVSCDSSRW
eukprot:jgi/Bigna1/73423/fgenesh1_pg.24_\